jgi:hypothetical protein
MNQHPWAQQAAQAYQTYLDLVQAQKAAQSTTEGSTMTAKHDAMLDIETQFMGIMRKIELAYGRYALNDDTARASILYRMHNAADAGRRLCDEFRAAGEHNQRMARSTKLRTNSPRATMLTP